MELCAVHILFRRQFQIKKSFYKLFIKFVTGTGYCWCYCFSFFSVILKTDSLGLESTGRFSDGMAHGFSIAFVSS